MMLTRTWPTAALAVTLLTAGLIWETAPARNNSGDGSGPITAAEVVERTRRALSVPPDSAETWLKGVAGVDEPLARLEHGLLEALGPDPVRDRKTGLERLQEMLQLDSGLLEPEAAQTVRVLISLISTNTALATEIHRLRGELQAEREDHRRTREKLEALRKIDEQLESRNNGEDDGEPRG